MSAMPTILQLFRRFLPDIIFPLLVTAIAMVVRIHLLRQYAAPLMIHEQDAVGYMNLATSLLRFSLDGLMSRPPGYPAVIAFCSLFTNNLEYAARIASILMDALICIPLYVLARAVLSSLTAALASSMWAFFSFALYFCISPLSQSTWLFFTICSICALTYALRLPEQRNVLMAVAAVGSALSYLTRPEGILIFAFGLPLFAVILLFQKHRLKSVLKPIILFTSIFVLLSSPFIIYLKYHTGSWDITSKTSNVLKSEDGLMTLDAKGNTLKVKNGLGAWADHYNSLPQFIQTARDNFCQFAELFYSIFPVWMHITVLIGFILLAVFHCRETLLLSILLLLTLPNYIVYVTKTLSYLYSVFPFYFIAFMAFFEFTPKAVTLFSRFTMVDKLRYASFLLAAVVTCLASFSSVNEVKGVLGSPERQYEALITREIFINASTFIRNAAQKNDTVMTRWGLISYYSGVPVVTLPKGDVNSVLEYGRKHHVRWLLIDTPSIYSRRQELEVLLNPTHAAQLLDKYGLIPVHSGGINGIGGYVLYLYM